MAEQYVCAKCGAPGVVDPGFTKMDARYATGRCTGEHEGKQYLVLESFNPTVKTKQHRKGTR
jgi:hypothetical protein